MKKTLIALCGALSLAAFADPAPSAPSAESEARPPVEAGDRPRHRMPKPTMLVINEKTTAEDLAAFKAEVAKKIDDSFASYAAKSGEEKQPVRLVLFSNEGMGRGRGPGMGPRGEGRGPRGEGRGPRGDHPRRNRGGEGEAPKPAEEVK